jgi:hypothetical protein
MKYIKLFENWLNEAEEGKSEVKPFDAKKPFETLVVDISNEDFEKSDKGQKSIILSILAKCFDKTEKVEESKVMVRGYKADFDEGNVGGTSRLNIENDNESLRVFFKTNDEGFFDKITKFSSKPCFLVTKIDSFKHNDNGYLNRSKSESIPVILVFPEDGGDPKDFVLNSKCLIYNHNLVAVNKEKNFFEGTIGSLAAWSADQFKFASIDKLKDTNAGKPQNIAKALGYEIPDNYAPKDGGIEVTTK